MTDEQSSFQLMRSILFVPCIVQKFIDRAPKSGADVICLDLEDSVPPAEKRTAREKASEALESMPRSGYDLIVRVNALGTGLLEEDLTAVVKPGLDGISLPKTDTVETVMRADNYLSLLEKQRGMKEGAVKIIPFLETAQGVINAREICRSSDRLVGAAVGAEDFATDMRIVRRRDSKEVEWPRAQVAIACNAAGIMPIDTPEIDYKDLDHLEEECHFARSVGYKGKYCIHPAQVETINRMFGPAEQEMIQAQQMIDRFEKDGIAKGVAAISVDGKLVDWPIYVRAQQFLKWADMAQATDRARLGE